MHQNQVHITYFVHGTTTDNEAGISTGWNPGELSELGVQQSVQLKDLIKGKTFDVIFSSDLKRAVDSAALTFPDTKVIIDERLRECNYGQFNGGPEKTVEQMYHTCVDTPFPDGESMMDVERRIRDFCAMLLQEYNGKHIAIVAHKAPQLAFEVIANRKTWREAIRTDWRITKSWQPGWEYIVYA